MATFPARWAGVLTRLLLASLILTSGCVLFTKFQQDDKKAPEGVAPQASPQPAGPRPTQIALLWQPNIIPAPDPTRGGAMNPGLAGRMLLTGADGMLAYFDGTLTVIAHDISACSPNAVPPPRFLYKWTFPAAVLHKLEGEDVTGKGYTLYCPFPPGVLRPGITRVQLQVAFESPGAPPLYSNPDKMSLGSQVNDFITNSGIVGQPTMAVSNKPK